MNLKLKLLLVFTAFLLVNRAHAQDKRIYVAPTDTALKLDLKYNDPKRASYNVGGLVGVDVSGFEGILFGEVEGTYSPKNFTFKGAYAFDISNSDFISKNSLLAYGNTYKSLNLTAVFNFKDETKSMDYEPTVGVEVIGKSTERTGTTKTITTKYYAYKTDYKFDTRRTKGIGVSIKNQSSNIFVNTVQIDSTKEFIKLSNAATLPAQFILPFRSTEIGIGLHTGVFTSYKLRTQYKDLGRLTNKASSFKMTSVEILFAPTISTDDFIYFETNGTKQSLGIEDYKVRRIGFRLSVSTNEGTKQLSKLANKKPGFYKKAELGMKTGIYPKRAFETEDPDFLDKVVLGFLSNPVYLRFAYGFTF